MEGVARTFLPQREPDRHHHLVGLAGGVQQAELEIGSGELPGGAFGTQDHRSGQGRKAQRQLGAGVAVGDAAADGAAAAGLEMADMGQGLGEQRRSRREFRPRQQARLRGSRADLDVGGVQAHVIQLLDVGDVDEHLGLDQTEIHRRHQRQAAGDDPRVLAVAREASQRLGQTARADVFESAWLHRAIPSNWSRRRHQDRAAEETSGAPVDAPSLWKNWFISTRAVPSSMRAPTAATLPLMSNP